jgi:hypothetical protein
MERWAFQVPHYCEKRDITEIHPATPHIDGILAFQVYRIYQETLLQYFPNTWVSAPCSDISRCRNSAPKCQVHQAFILPLPSPLSTTVRTSWNAESKPVFHAESARQLHLSLAPLVVELRAKSALILKIPSFFVVPSDHHFLQSETLGWCILDQFYALNTRVISIYP